MADTIKIGNTDISAFKVGSGDCTIYLGSTLLYSGGTTPVFEWKYKLTLSDSSTVSAECDGTSAVTSGEVASQYSGSVVSAEIGCVTSISQYTFQRCSGLTSCTIGSGVTSIGDSAFRDCRSLTSIDIPSGVTSIGDSAFYNCRSLTSIDIPSGVTSISQYTFQRCISLTNITIPSSITSIGDSAFKDCRSLTSIDIPSGVTSIGSNAFYGCTSLTSVNIPSSITSIGLRAFINCTSLASITVEATTPPTLGSQAFNNTNDCPIYVPSGSVSTYQTTGNWASLASRIQAIPNN